MYVKVCGLRHTDNINSLLQVKLDYIGFIFYKKSKRHVLDIGAQPFIQDIKGVKKVGVFVNEELETVKEIIIDYKLDVVQLHGDESVGYCKLLSRVSAVEIVKVFSVDDQFDFDQTKKYEAYCDLFLFDTKGKERGGNGVVFDWGVLKKYTGKKPFFLSGGIGPEHVSELVKINHPKFIGIDVNSRFETEPGRKDVEAVRLFVEGLNDHLLIKPKV